MVGDILSILSDIFARLRLRDRVSRATLLARVRAARKRAEETGDTSELEKIRDDLPSMR